jgi:hypothetical protein
MTAPIAAAETDACAHRTLDGQREVNELNFVPFTARAPKPMQPWLLGFSHNN